MTVAEQRMRDLWSAVEISLDDEEDLIPVGPSIEDELANVREVAFLHAVAVDELKRDREKLLKGLREERDQLVLALLYVERVREACISSMRRVDALLAREGE